MSKNTFYDVLGVAQDASTEEIKKRYKVLALQCHPDKNLDNVKEATEKFSLIQEAYAVLSDAKERDWYDRHKEAFHADQADVVDYSIDAIYLSADCYSGFDDSKNGFYSVYRELFDQIIEQEAPHREVNDEHVYPRFGNSKTDPLTVKQFYDIWQSFSTALSFAHLDKYDIRVAPNRRIVRLMEKENKKIRDEAKRTRNALVQELVQFVRKRDKRMEQYRKMLQAKVAENRQKSALHWQKMMEERKKQFEGYVEPEWTSMGALERELEEIEANAADYYEGISKKGKGKKSKRNVDDEPSYQPVVYEQIVRNCTVCNRKFNPHSLWIHVLSTTHMVAEDKEAED